MSASTAVASPSPAALHPLLQRLVATTGATVLDPASFDAWASMPGEAMAVFVEDPERFKETLDLAVIVPELHAAYGGRFRVGFLPPTASRALLGRFGFARWPAIVMLRGGGYLGAIDGIRDWDVYVAELARLLAASPTRPPGIGIPVRAADDGSSASACH